MALENKKIFYMQRPLFSVAETICLKDADSAVLYGIYQSKASLSVDLFFVFFLISIFVTAILLEFKNLGGAPWFLFALPIPLFSRKYLTAFSDKDMQQCQVQVKRRSRISIFNMYYEISDSFGNPLAIIQHKYFATRRQKWICYNPEMEILFIAQVDFKRIIPVQGRNIFPIAFLEPESDTLLGSIIWEKTDTGHATLEYFSMAENKRQDKIMFALSLMIDKQVFTRKLTD